MIKRIRYVHLLVVIDILFLMIKFSRLEKLTGFKLDDKTIKNVSTFASI